MAKHKVEQTCFITAQLHHPGEVIDYSGVEMPGVLTPLKQRQTVAPPVTVVPVTAQTGSIENAGDGENGGQEDTDLA